MQLIALPVAAHLAAYLAAERSGRLKTQNALECQRLTPSYSCTAFDVDMFFFCGGLAQCWLRLSA